MPLITLYSLTLFSILTLILTLFSLLTLIITLFSILILFLTLFSIVTLILTLLFVFDTDSDTVFDMISTPDTDTICLVTLTVTRLLTLVISLPQLTPWSLGGHL